MTNNGIKFIIVFFLKIYKYTISAILPPSCRFHPSCSEYAVSAINKYGVQKGVWYAIKRFARCHPFGNGGYDPV
jgi:putative membrane protein insertion efficiency factor